MSADSIHAGRSPDSAAGAGLSRIEKLAVALGASALAMAAGPRMWREWQANGDYGHVAVTLPVAAWFLRNAIRESAARAGRRAADWPVAILLLAAATACLLLDAALEEEFLLGLGLWLGTLGAVALLAGRPALRSSAFAAAMLFFAVPLPHAILRNAFHEHLQRLGAAVSAGLLSMGGFDAEASGTLVLVAGKGLNVAEACSGLKFITVLVFAALCMWRLRFRGALAAAWLAAAAVAVAFAANAARLVAAGAIMSRFGRAAAQGFLHGPAVYVVYAAAITTFLVIASAARAETDGPAQVRGEGLSCA